MGSTKKENRKEGARICLFLFGVLVLSTGFFLLYLRLAVERVEGKKKPDIREATIPAQTLQPKRFASDSEQRRLSPAVRVFASLSGAVPADVRRKRLAEFPDLLSETEVSALTGLLATAESRIPGVSPRDALALKNEAADALLSRAPSGAGLAAFFASQFLDARNSRGWRDYALQALPWACLRDRDPASLRLAGNVFAAVFSSPRLRHFRGTALNGLAALDRAGAGLAAVPLEPAALSVLRDP